MTLIDLTRKRLATAKRAFTTRRVAGSDMAQLLRGNQVPETGDLVFAKVQEIGKHRKIEKPNGRRARQEMGQSEDSLEAAKRAVAAETSLTFQDLLAARSNIQSTDLQVTAARQALEGAKKEADVGQRTTLDLLDLEDDLFQAEIALATARQDEVVAAYRLRQALGVLTADALELPGARNDAENYDQENRNCLIGFGG